MAKRVKWERQKYMVFANLKVDALVIDLLLPDVYMVDLCFCPKRRFTTLKAAQRYCIREAKKLHKVVGTQLDQLAKEAE